MNPMVTNHRWSIRPAAQAGRFYSADPNRLEAEVRDYLDTPGQGEGLAPKAIIAPHAGYSFSGAIAGTAYAALEPIRARIRTVVLLGPAHYVGFDGVASASWDGFATPLGVVAVDRRKTDDLSDRRLVRENNVAHRPEHSLEVQLPFLQIVLEKCLIVPLLVGRAEDHEVQAVIEHLWAGPETLVVVSSDLSHFQDYRAAQNRDARTARAIEALSPTDLTPDDACGARAIRGLLGAVRARGLKCRTLDLRNSGDTAGPRDRVVGYGAFTFG